jgi:hypothetical protein
VTLILHSHQYIGHQDKKISKETSELNNTIDQMDLNIYRIFHPSAAEHTFFSTACGTFFKIDHILDHKETLNKYKKTEIASCILVDNNGIKLESAAKETIEDIPTHGDWIIHF